MGDKGTDGTSMRALPCTLGRRDIATFLPLGGLGTCIMHAGPMFLALWDSGLASLAHHKWKLGNSTAGA